MDWKALGKAIGVALIMSGILALFIWLFAITKGIFMLVCIFIGMVSVAYYVIKDETCR